MSDSISRQAAIDAVNRLSLGETDATRLAMRIWDYLERLPSAQPTFGARDTQYNLPIGTDLISRQAAMDALNNELRCGAVINQCGLEAAYEVIEDLPSAQPDIIRCRNCKFASGDSRICMQFGHSPIGELDFCSFAERREVNNESN